MPLANGYPSYKFLATQITETQGSEYWCNAYATAFIIRYIKGNSDDTEALDVMRYFYSSPQITDRLSVINTVEYANYRSVYPTYMDEFISTTAIMAQITLYQPVFISMYDTLDQQPDHSVHAVVIRGYNYTIGTWSLWNPWYNSFETWMMNDSYTPSEGQAREYEPFETIYDWS